MAESTAQKVLKILEKNPKITNKELYEAFPTVRPNTIRHYKSKFLKAMNVKPSEKRSPKQQNSGRKRKVEPDFLKEKVFEFFRKNPTASNQRFYKEFSRFSRNKLKEYREIFFKERTTGEPAVKNKSRASAIRDRVTAGAKKAIRSPARTDVEKRLDNLEAKVDRLTDLLAQNTLVETGKKLTVPVKPEGLEKRIRELEQNLLGFIKEKQGKIKTELSSLDEMQVIVTNKISQFLSAVKAKR